MDGKNLESLKESMGDNGDIPLWHIDVDGGTQGRMIEELKPIVFSMSCILSLPLRYAVILKAVLGKNRQCRAN